MALLAHINGKVQASTLVEVLVAMVLITITLGLALMIHTNVMNSSKHRLELEAQLHVNNVAQQTKHDKSYFDVLIEAEHFVLKKVVQPYSRDNERLQIMVIQAIAADGKVIAERRELVR